MSERFSDEVLQRAWEEGYDLFSHELINNFEAPDRTVVVAAMRAVLEGHEHAALQADASKYNPPIVVPPYITTVPQQTIRALREIAEKRKKDDGDE